MNNFFVVDFRSHQPCGMSFVLEVHVNFVAPCISVYAGLVKEPACMGLDHEPEPFHWFGWFNILVAC